VNGLRQLWRGGLRAVVGLSSATVLGQLLLAVLVPVLTRLYAPDAFGVFASFSGIAMTVLVVAALRLEMAIPLERHDGHARQLLAGTLVVIAGVAALSAIVVVVIHGLLLAGVGGALPDARLAALLWWLPPFILLAGANRAFVSFTVRAQRFTDVASMRLVQPPITIVTQVGGGLLHLGEQALTLGFILGQTAGLAHLARRAGGLRAVVRDRLPRARLRALWRRHRRFPLLDTPAALADTLGAHLPTIVLGVLSPGAAAVYAVHQRLLLGPATIVSQAIGQVLLGRARHDRETGTLAGHTRRLALGLLIVAAALAGLGAFVVEPVMARVLGEGWAGACGPVARPFLLGVCGQFVYAPLSTTLLATDGQHVNLALHLLLLVLKAVVLGVTVGRGVEDAIVGVSLLNGLVYLLGAGAVVVHVARFEERKD
jgi:O-antigen/teichoic acid export membrane protein